MKRAGATGHEGTNSPTEPMKRSATPKVHAYLAFVAVLLVAAFAVRRPELAIVATPFALLLVFGAAGRGEPPRLTIALAPPRERALEGESLTFQLTVGADRAVGLLDMAVTVPAGLEPAVTTYTLADLRSGEKRAVELPLRAAHWGAFTKASCALRARSPHGFFWDEGQAQAAFALRVYPRAEALRNVVTPHETQPYAGNLVARGAGAGIEFADIRAYQPGDELRRVNWRVSARRGSMWVNAQRPERNADVILFLDTFDIGSTGVAALNLSVRAAAGLAARYLLDRDRVGVIGFGGVLRWLIPGSGDRQLYQIVESLITTQLSFSYAWKDVSVIPTHTLPPQALVIALTPLVDERVVTALFDLLRRGFDLAVIDVSPALFPAHGADLQTLAGRIWQLERQALLDRYRALGGAVARWSDDRPLQAVVEEVTQFRRHARIVNAF